MTIRSPSRKWLLAVAQLFVTFVSVNVAEWQECRHAIWLEQVTGHKPQEVDLAYTPTARILNLLVSGPASQVTVGSRCGEKIVIPSVALICVFAFWLWVGWILERRSFIPLGGQSIVPERRWISLLCAFAYALASVSIALFAVATITKRTPWLGFNGCDLWLSLRLYGMSASPIAEVLRLVWLLGIVILFLVQSLRELKTVLAH